MCAFEIVDIFYTYFKMKRSFLLYMRCFFDRNPVIIEEYKDNLN